MSSRVLVLLVGFALVVAACGSDETVATSTTTSAAETTTTAAAETTTTGAADAITTTVDATTTTASASGAAFAITTVSFGDTPMIVITNAGDATGSLSGHFLCQRPSYWALPDVELEPGQSLAISAGGSSFDPPEGALTVEDIATVGSLSSGSGELGLYSSSDFASSGDIVSYVEWGEAGHGRSSVAMEAGIWGGFVATSDDTARITAVSELPTRASDWSAEG